MPTIQVADKPTLDDTKTAALEAKTEALNAKTEALSAKTVAESADTKLGTATDSGGTSSAGTVAAKLNKIITDLADLAGDLATTDLAVDSVASVVGLSTDVASVTPATLFAGLKYLLANGASVIRNIQRGTATITAPDVDVIVNLDTFLTSTNKCLVLINGSDTSGTSPYLFAMSSSSLAFRKADTNLSCNFSWQVIEFY